MTVNGRCYPLPTLERPTSDSASGLWPTPGANDWKGSARWGQRRRQLDERVENQERDRRDSSMPRVVVTGSLNPIFVEWLQGFPTGWTDCDV